ncbi:uncharacterized protein LOC121706579 isoform X2 [Alosa sapidissima]|uniref:uncharacterized protein LOC121706579 isoform X2 n=1 Tax=Alosa sapidissima TaxID=34773 RepID=UPI001C091EE5|nr:uncharacterized protein LOC121706579 isoform X2 [Alosa sapidissima]
MAVMAKVVVLLLIASFSNVFCFPKRDVTKRDADEVDVSTTTNPSNQTQTEANGGASEDVQAGTPVPNPHNQTATAQPDVTDEASEDDVVTATPRPQNQTTPDAQSGNAEKDEAKRSYALDELTTTPSPLNKTMSSATDGVTDGASEDAVLTTVLNLQNGTTSAQEGTTITDSHDDS